MHTIQDACHCENFMFVLKGSEDYFTEIEESEFPKDCPYGDNDLLDPDFFLFHVDFETSACELKWCLADG